MTYINISQNELKILLCFMPLKDCGTPLNKAGFQLNMGTWLQLVDCIYLQDTLNSQKQKLYNMF